MFITFYNIVSNGYDHPSTHIYIRILLHRIDKCKDNNNLLVDIRINKSKNHYQEYRRITIQEKTLHSFLTSSSKK